MSRLIFIGDIHGCRDELVDLLDKVAITEDDVVVSVGDVVDRGPDPLGCVELLRDRPNTVVLMGNHERKHVRGTLSYSQEIVRVQLGEAYADAVAWMSGLPYYFRDDRVIAVHAALVPGTPLEATPVEILAGTTSGEERLGKQLGGRYWHELYQDPTPVVFGHHVVSEPLVIDDRIYGIDTGCCFGGALTALTVPDFRLWSVPSRGDSWRETQRIWQVPVLRARPWATMTWDQITSKAAELGRRHPAGAKWLEGVVGWAGEIRASIPRIHAAALLALDALGDDSAAIAAHPAGPTLFQIRRGRLAADALGCSSPAQVHALARGLSVDLGLPEAPP